MITNTSATFTVLGINGRVKETGVTRPIRVIPDGTFGVVLNGKVRKLNTSTFTVDMTSTETFDPATCRAAKLADIKAASPAPAEASTPSMPTTVTMAPAKAALVKGPRSQKQREATLRLTEANLSKAKATGDANRIAKAEKAVATAKANLVASPLPPTKVEVVNIDEVVSTLKASGINMSDLLIALAAKI